MIDLIRSSQDQAQAHLPKGYPFVTDYYNANLDVDQILHAPAIKLVEFKPTIFRKPFFNCFDPP
jgi:hypothetical protein